MEGLHQVILKSIVQEKYGGNAAKIIRGKLQYQQGQREVDVPIVLEDTLLRGKMICRH